MPELTDHLEEIKNASDAIQIGNFGFHPTHSSQHRVTYKNHNLVDEEISPERLNEYEQAATHYETWANGDDLPDINNWTNIYGEPYWKYEEASLTFRTLGSHRKNGYKGRIHHPKYFNPPCTINYHRTKDATVLNLILTLIRHNPNEAAYQHHYQKAIISQLQEIRGIGQKTAEKFYELGVRDYPDIKAHKGHIERQYRHDALETINQKLENNTEILKETNFLDNYGHQHLAKTI